LDLYRIVSSGRGDETILPYAETIIRFDAEPRKRQMVINVPTERLIEPTGNRRPSMQTFSSILAVVFVLAGPTLAGSPDGNLPGIGTFVYNGSPIVTTAPQAVVVATR
jgi:hypothetical protein